MDILLLIFCGLISGFMNTLASSGSAITLPAMIFLGVPPSVANATNRLPILVSSSISVFNFHKSGDIVWSKTVLISIPVFFGTLTGSVLVKYFDVKYVQILVFIAMIFSFILITTNSRSLLKGRSVINKKVTPKNHVIFSHWGMGRFDCFRFGSFNAF